MSSPQRHATVIESPTGVEPQLENATDYGARAMALWPRLERDRLARAQNDPARVAALISQRTTLPLGAILELLGVPIGEGRHAARGR